MLFVIYAETELGDRGGGRSWRRGQGVGGGECEEAGRVRRRGGESDRGAKENGRAIGQPGEAFRGEAGAGERLSKRVKWEQGEAERRGRAWGPALPRSATARCGIRADERRVAAGFQERK